MDSGGPLVNAKEPRVDFKACFYTKAEQSIRDSQTVSKTTRPFLFLSIMSLLLANSLNFYFDVPLALASAVRMNTTRQCVLSIEQSALSHWLNQSILTILKKTEASQLEFKWLMSQNGLQMGSHTTEITQTF